MIDLNLYRFRVFDFRSKLKPQRLKFSDRAGNCIPNQGLNSSLSVFFIMYLYYILCITFIIMAITLKLDGFPISCLSPNMTNVEFIHVRQANVKLFFVILP